MNKKTVLILGSSGMIGEKIALHLAKQKYDIILHYFQSEEKIDRIQKQIKNLGSKVLKIQCDVSEYKQVKSMFMQIKQWNKILDVCINSAGITMDHPMLITTEYQWRRCLDVNLTGTFLCMKESAKLMMNQSSGYILNIASFLGVHPKIGSSIYSASKAGMIALTKSAALELQRYSICVNTLLPGKHTSSQMVKNKNDTTDSKVDLDELCEFISNMIHFKSVSGQILNFDARIL